MICGHQREDDCGCVHTPTDPKPTAPPTVAPASDEEISGYGGEIAIYQRGVDRYLHCVQCDASPGSMGGHRPGCDFTVWPRIKARIEADRAENDRLRARVAELKEVLKAAIGHCDCLDYNGKALIPCTEANPCAGCYMAAQIRAALKPEPARGSEKL